MYPILLSFSTHFSTLFINNSSIQNILSQDNLSQNKILLIFCAACFAGYFIAYIKKDPQHFFPSSDAVPPVFRSFTFFNFFCAARDIITGIGINPITGAVCTVLGIPGAILLYAIKIYSFL